MLASLQITLRLASLKEMTDPDCGSGFRSVVVITFASHAKGLRFEPGREHRVRAF